MSFTPYSTVEVRWFYPGGIPVEVKNGFFRDESYSEAQPERVDKYFTVAGDPDLGIKMREGRLEIKHLTDKFGPFRLGSQVVGIMEGWEKWGFVLSEHFYNQNAKSSHEGIEVRKQRWLRKFQFAKEGMVNPIYPQFIINQGCDWELSKIQVVGSNEIWWSMAFEAFGDKSITMRTTISKVVEISLKSMVDWKFQVENSLSYPAWLNLIMAT